MANVQDNASFNKIDVNFFIKNYDISVEILIIYTYK